MARRWPAKSQLTPRERQIREVMERKDRVVDDFDLPRFRRRLRWALIGAMALQPVIVVLLVWHGLYGAISANIVAIPICALGLFFLKFAEIRDQGPLQPADGQDGPAGPEPQTPVQTSAGPPPTPSSNSAPRAHFVAPPLLGEEEPLERRSSEEILRAQRDALDHALGETPRCNCHLHGQDVGPWTCPHHGRVYPSPQPRWLPDADDDTDPFADDD